MPLDLNQCDSACIKCIRRYKKKHSLTTGQTFNIKCKGIPKIGEQLDLFEEMGEADRDTALAMLDPVTWAAQTLDWHCLDPDGEIWKRRDPEEYREWKEAHPDESIEGKSRYHRPYQAEMLRCSAKSKVFRIGRQCLAGKSKVYLADGSWKYIKDIKVGDEVLSVNKEHLLVSSVVKEQWSTGTKKVYRIRTKFGHDIVCTANHRFLIVNSNVDRCHNQTIDQLFQEWLSIDTGLTIGSKIAIPLSLPSPLSSSVGPLAPLLGYFLADGSCSHGQSAKFTNITMEYLLDFEDLARQLGTRVKWYKKGKGYDLVLSNGRGQCNPVRAILKGLGLTNITGPDKFIPDCVFNANFQDTRAFLRNFWAADGYISTFQRTGRATKRTEIGTLQESYRLVQQIQELLWRFGVHGYIKKEGNCYRLVISNKISVQNFLECIGPIQGKEAACEEALENLATISDKYFSVSGDLLWDYVTSIEEVGEEETWDIEVEETHNFISNCFLTHNCGKTEAIVVSMLYHMFTKPGIPEDLGFKIVVIAPYQAQIDLIFRRLLQLVRSNPVTNNSLRRHVKAPIYTIELHNGSTVMGFTAGTKSGGNAESVRGQSAHMLVFDEADYLSSHDMEAAYSIITNHPNASVWMSSTPSGKREKFYYTCHSKIFREFHYTSHANPMWDDRLETLFHEQFTEIAYKHEVLAEFGEQEEGVFQNSYVQAAKADYKYGDIQHHHTWTYTIGVDWNDTRNGTCIVVLGFDPSRNLFCIVDRQVVSREGWTQLAACQKIAELNRLWRPLAIYIDSGFGGTQWEVLRKFGYDSAADSSKGPNHPDARLKDIVKKYEFGGSIEIRDPFTKQPVKKPAKSFLVESTVRRFESQDLKYSSSDELLERQLLGYIIKRITQHGVPVYEAADDTTGDHILDALMCAVVAVVLEASPLGKPRFSTAIGFSGYFGENNSPEIFTGDTLVQDSDPRRKEEKLRERSRPSMNRTETVEKKTLMGVHGNLPGSHLVQEKQIGLWDWPGFMRDEPRPRTRTMGEAESEARKRLGISPRMVSRPRRKNI